MNVLPDDILFQIFSLFCFHCGHPGYFPHSDTDRVRNNKRTLAYLCRVSKDTCAVAQPILYHYYATGNMMIGTRLYRTSYEFESLKTAEEPDLLPQFLRTVIQRPDLASRIVTMQIVHELEFAGYEAAIPALEFILEFNSVKKLLPEFKVSKDWEDTLCSQRENSYGSTLRVWLTSLSLAVLPNLKSLVLSIEHGAGMPLDDCPDVQLQSLQTLGLTYYRSDYHFNELASLYAAAPNLNTIYASDCGGVAMHPLAPPDACELSLPNLRKLAISCLRIDDMVNLLDRVPQVEDLEYYYLGWQRNMHGKLDFMLEPLQKSLKRLCVSHLPRNHWNGGDPHPKWMELPEENFPPMDTLASFEKLEDLTIDCRFIYCDYASTGGNLTPAVSEPDGNNRLITMLPRSIRRLRISYVYRGMKRDLFGLAECRNEKFPYLEQVVMGFVERPNPMCHEAIEQTKEVGSLFQRDGVAFSIEIDRMGPETKTIVPGGTLSSRFVPVAGTQHTPCQESCCGGPITVIRLHR